MTASLYETTDIYLASFLLCQGATLHAYEHMGPRRVQFRFVADEKFHAMLRLYWGNASVTLVPIALFTSLKRLRSLVRRRPENKTASAADSQTASASSPQLC